MKESLRLARILADDPEFLQYIVTIIDLTAIAQRGGAYAEATISDVQDTVQRLTALIESKARRFLVEDFPIQDSDVLEYAAAAHYLGITYDALAHAVYRKRIVTITNPLNRRKKLITRAELERYKQEKWQ